MERSLFIRIGLAMEAVDEASTVQFRAEANCFIEAVKLSLNAIVPADYNVAVGTMLYGLCVSISSDDESSEAEKYIEEGIKHVKDMVQYYGMHFGGCLLLTID